MFGRWFVGIDGAECAEPLLTSNGVLAARHPSIATHLHGTWDGTARAGEPLSFTARHMMVEAQMRRGAPFRKQDGAAPLFHPPGPAQRVEDSHRERRENRKAQRTPTS
jgi:hypothetical protein